MTWTVPAMSGGTYRRHGRHWPLVVALVSAGWAVMGPRCERCLAVLDRRARHGDLADRGDRHDRRERDEGGEERIANQALALARCNVLEVTHVRFPVMRQPPRSPAFFSSRASYDRLISRS